MRGTHALPPDVVRSGALTEADTANATTILRNTAWIAARISADGWATDPVALAALAIMADDLANAAADLRSAHRPEGPKRSVNVY